MKEIVLTRTAFKDLEAIRTHIATDSVEAAERVVAELELYVRKLSDMPGIGHKHPDIPNAAYRVWRVYSYFIVYRSQKTRIVVSRVVHGAQDFRRLFPQRKRS